MDISVVDRSAATGASWLHRAAPGAKVAAFALLVGAVVVTWNAFLALGLALGLAALVPACRLPARAAFALAAYPAVFAAVFAFASAPDPLTAGLIVLKAVAAALAAVVLVLTTPYPQVFAPVQRITPSLVGDALLMTYRSLFILLDKAADLLRAVRLRSAGDSGVLSEARATARALGGLLLYALDLAQRDYDILRARGYEGRLRASLPRSDSAARDAALIAAAGTALALSAVWRIESGALNPYSWLLPVPGIVWLSALGVAAAVRRRRST